MELNNLQAPQNYIKFNLQLDNNNLYVDEYVFNLHPNSFFSLETLNLGYEGDYQHKIYFDSFIKLNPVVNVPIDYPIFDIKLYYQPLFTHDENIWTSFNYQSSLLNSDQFYFKNSSLKFLKQKIDPEMIDTVDPNDLLDPTVTNEKIQHTFHVFDFINTPETRNLCGFYKIGISFVSIYDKFSTDVDLNNIIHEFYYQNACQFINYKKIVKLGENHPLMVMIGQDYFENHPVYLQNEIIYGPLTNSKNSLARRLDPIFSGDYEDGKAFRKTPLNHISLLNTLLPLQAFSVESEIHNLKSKPDKIIDLETQQKLYCDKFTSNPIIEPDSINSNYEGKIKFTLKVKTYSYALEISNPKFETTMLIENFINSKIIKVYYSYKANSKDNDYDFNLFNKNYFQLLDSSISRADIELEPDGSAENNLRVSGEFEINKNILLNDVGRIVFVLEQKKNSLPYFRCQCKISSSLARCNTENNLLNYSGQEFNKYNYHSLQLRHDLDHEILNVNNFQPGFKYFYYVKLIKNNCDNKKFEQYQHFSNYLNYDDEIDKFAHQVEVELEPDLTNPVYRKCENKVYIKRREQKNNFDDFQYPKVSITVDIYLSNMRNNSVISHTDTFGIPTFYHKKLGSYSFDRSESEFSLNSVLFDQLLCQNGQLFQESLISYLDLIVIISESFYDDDRNLQFSQKERKIPITLDHRYCNFNMMNNQEIMIKFNQIEITKTLGLKNAVNVKTLIDSKPMAKPFELQVSFTSLNHTEKYELATQDLMCSGSGECSLPQSVQFEDYYDCFGDQFELFLIKFYDVSDKNSADQKIYQQIVKMPLCKIPKNYLIFTSTPTIECNKVTRVPNLEFSSSHKYVNVESNESRFNCNITADLSTFYHSLNATRHTNLMKPDCRKIDFVIQLFTDNSKNDVIFEKYVYWVSLLKSFAGYLQQKN